MAVLVKILRLVGVLAAALVLGLTLTHVLQAPGSRGLDGATWLQVQHTFYGGFVVVGGIAEIAGLVATAAVAVLLRHRARTALAHAVAAACLLGTLLAYWFGNRPVNVKVAHWTAATLPANWPAYRDTWETAHAVSSVLAAVATVALLVATVWGGTSGPGRGQLAPSTKRREHDHVPP
jgi:hypothetical protein